MSLISFEFIKPYLYFILVWVLNTINTFFNDLRFGKNQILFMTLHLIYLNIGELLSGFLVLYTKLKMNRLQKKETYTSRNKTIEPELIYNDLSLKKNIKILIFLVSLLDFLGRSYTIIYVLFFNGYLLGKHHLKWINSVDLLARIFFCRIMLKIKLYKHHKISIYICLLAFLIMAILTFQSIIFDKDGKYNQLKCWIYILFTIIQKFFFALEDTISKILLTSKFVLPHYLMFFRSLVGFFFYVILVICLFLCSKVHLRDFVSILDLDNLKLYIGYILYKIFFSGLFVNFAIFKIIDIFTPIHVGFLNIVSSLIEVIKLTSEDSEIEYILFYMIFIICFVFIGIGGLIFTEILIVNACGLNEYTKTGLLLKEKLDQAPPNSTIFVDINDDKSEFYDNDRSEIVGSITDPNSTIRFSYKKKRYSNI